MPGSVLWLFAESWEWIDGDWKKKIDNKDPFTPQQISAFVLQKLKGDPEAYLGEKITDAVIVRSADGGLGSHRGPCG